jgi:antitoxin ParD1/3/4
MPTRNVVLTDKQAELIEKLVDSGRYQNASEVLREGLRLLQRRELEDAAKLEALRGALDEAEVAVAAGDLYDYSPTLFDMVEEDERVSSTRDSRGWGGFVLPARRDATSPEYSNAVQQTSVTRRVDVIGDWSSKLCRISATMPLEPVCDQSMTFDRAILCTTWNGAERIPEAHR